MTKLTGVDNGQRIDYDFPGIIGQAGFREKPGGLAELAFRSESRADPAKVGTVIEAAGKRWTVLRSARNRQANMYEYQLQEAPSDG